MAFGSAPDSEAPPNGFSLTGFNHVPLMPSEEDANCQSEGSLSRTLSPPFSSASLHLFAAVSFFFFYPRFPMIILPSFTLLSFPTVPPCAAVNVLAPPPAPTFRSVCLVWPKFIGKNLHMCLIKKRSARKVMQCMQDSEGVLLDLQPFLPPSVCAA